jgi:hypothetical protein
MNGTLTIRTSRMYCALCGVVPLSGKADATQEEMEAAHVAWHSDNVARDGWPWPTGGIEPVFGALFKRR